LRTPSRARAGRGRMALAVSCASVGLLVPSPSLASAPGEAAHGLRIARALNSGKPLAGAGHVSTAIKEIVDGYGRLSSRDRREARQILARPTDGAADPQNSGYSVPEAPQSPFCTADFCVHWVTATDDAPPLADSDGDGVPDYVESAAAVAQNVHSVENGELGWREPKGDGTRGGDVDKTDVYLKQLGGSGVFGYTAVDPEQLNPAPRDNSLYSYLVIDNDFAPAEFRGYTNPLLPLEVTLAHEYNHVLHYTYDALEDTWLFEATAVWMEDKVYNDVNDYLSYLPGWVSATDVPLTSFNGNNPNDRSNAKVYGSAVWTKYVDQHFGQDAVRNVWERSSTTRPPSFGAGAYDSMLRSRGSSFAATFARFAAATSEWQTMPGDFPEGGSYPDLPRVGTLKVDGSAGAIDLDHSTFQLVQIPRPTAGRVKLVVEMPDGTVGGLGLVGRRGSGAGSQVVTEVRDLPHGGTGQVQLDDPGSFDRLTAVLVNSDISQSGFSNATGDWAYRKDRQRFVAFVSSDFTPPRVTRRSPRKNASGVRVTAGVTVRFSERIAGVSSRTLELFGPGGRRVRASVRFRPGARTAALKPSRRLSPGARYRVSLRTGVTDQSLNALRPQAWSFRTGG
jgi:hypothetical protein